MQSYLFRKLFLFFCFIASLFANVTMESYFVIPNGSTSASCQFSDPCAFQTALTRTQSDGRSNSIFVGEGTYNLSGAALDFNITENYPLSIEGYSSATTILDGNYVNRLLYLHTNFSLSYPNAIITLRNLSFIKGNDDTGNGNGILIYSNDSPIIIENCQFIDNSSNDGSGGGAYLYSATGSIDVKKSIFRDNHADAGGGLYVYGSSANVSIVNNEFTNNSVLSVTEHNGGGLFSYVYKGATTIANNIFSENSAIENGGGLYSKITSYGTATITNNTFVKNSADLKGGGLYICMTVDDTSTTYIYNNVIWNNYSAMDNGNDIYIDNNGNSLGADTDLNYNLYGEKASDFYLVIPSKVTNSNFIHKNPLLSTPVILPDTRRSLRLIKGSPAIDAGSWSAAGVQSSDYEEGQRVVGSNINLGAVEMLANPILMPMYYLLLY